MSPKDGIPAIAAVLLNLFIFELRVNVWVAVAYVATIKQHGCDLHQGI